MRSALRVSTAAAPRLARSEWSVDKCARLATTWVSPSGLRIRRPRVHSIRKSAVSLPRVGLGDWWYRAARGGPAIREPRTKEPT